MGSGGAALASMGRGVDTGGPSRLAIVSGKPHRAAGDGSVAGGTTEVFAGLVDGVTLPHVVWDLVRVGNEVHYISLTVNSQTYTIDTYYKSPIGIRRRSTLPSRWMETISSSLSTCGSTKSTCWHANSAPFCPLAPQDGHADGACCRSCSRGILTAGVDLAPGRLFQKPR